MASTTPLPTLLKSLNIGLNAKSDDDESKDATASTSFASPKLSLTDQLYLLSAHIDTLEKSIHATVSSTSGKESIKRQIMDSVKIRQKVKDVNSRVHTLECEVQSNTDAERVAVLENLAQYVSAHNAYKREEKLRHIAVLIKGVLVAIEELESRLKSGHLEAKELALAVQNVDKTAAILGIRKRQAVVRVGTSQQSSYTWLAQPDGTSSIAIRHLSDRIEKTNKEIKVQLLERWNSCVRIQISEDCVRLDINEESQPLSLAQLMETFDSRSELEDLIEKFASNVTEMILKLLLNRNVPFGLHEHDCHSWKVTAISTKDDTGVLLASVESLLNLIRKTILKKTPEPLQSTFVFSKKLTPALIRSMIKHIRSALPKELKKPISSATLSVLDCLSKSVRNVYGALLQGDYLQQGLQDEGEELMQWSKDLNRQYMKNLATIQRRKAREMLLNEAKGGWEAVNIDLEVKEQDTQANPVAEIPLVKESSTDIRYEENGDDAWTNWDIEEPSVETTSEYVKSASHSTSKQKQKKSALGGKRVIRPQDELGSGPFPELDNGDDVSWGFDDRISAEGSSTLLGSNEAQAQYNALMKGLDEEEDVDEDAWGLSEEEKVERAAKRASVRGSMTDAFQAYQMRQEKQAEAVTNTFKEAIQEGYLEGEDEDDAWGLSAQEQDALNKKRKSDIIGVPGALQSVEKLEAKIAEDDVEDDAEDDDAWGLSIEEQEAISKKRHSMISQPEINSITPSSSTDTEHQTELDRKTSIPVQVEDKGDSISTPTQDAATRIESTKEEENAWGFNDSIIVPQIPARPVTPDQHNSLNAERPSLSSERSDTHSGTPKTSATSSSFTRTLQPLDMERDESVQAGDHDDAHGAPLEEAWEIRGEVLSVSEGAGTGDSRGEKSSGSGEKLSDTTTEPWEEVSASAVSLPVEGAGAIPPFSASSIGDWRWKEEAAVPAVAKSAGFPGTIAATSSASTRAASRIKSSSPSGSTSESRKKQQESPQIQQDALLDSQDTSVGRAPSKARSPAPIIRRFEKAVISQRSIRLIELIRETLVDIESIAKEKVQDTLDVTYLINVISDVLDLHRALIPVGHAEILATVPSLGMQFANDCSYIAKELKEMQVTWDKIEENLELEKEYAKIDFSKQAQLTDDLGKRSFDGQLLLQHKVLLDCLTDAQGFTSTHDEKNMQASERSLKQVELVLKQLQTAWKPVLTNSSYLSAMGRLVDGVLKKILLDIEALEDISEIESEKLASLIKTLGGLEVFFKDDNQKGQEQSVVALYVPSWFKASYLMEILTGSLVDIEFLYFEAGALIDYSKSEVISLIRSLFADTPKRARLIDRIQTS